MPDSQQYSFTLSYQVLIRFQCLEFQKTFFLWLLNNSFLRIYIARKHIGIIDRIKHF